MGTYLVLKVNSFRSMHQSCVVYQSLKDSDRNARSLLTQFTQLQTRIADRGCSLSLLLKQVSGIAVRSLTEPL